ncbi:hypothetical protein EJ06DRAFT_457765, partial [Trichodelitschia bisporula]
MVMLASLLGPAKPPVASEADVDAAPGLFTIESETVAGVQRLVAVSADERIPLLTVLEDGEERAERCLVCLADYEAADEARRLVKCGHLFHRECIDHWLTTGRNSCPLCRGEGV